MINLLPKWNLHSNRPTFYDTDSVTMLELAAKLHGAMNELITEYNQFVENTNATIQNFIDSTNQDQETFETALRQEFQDFIDIVDLKLKAMEEMNASLEIKYDELTESLNIGGAE